MKVFLVTICALVAASPDAVARCGPRFTSGVGKPETVVLVGPTGDAPAFYLRVFANPNRPMVVFFKPEDVVEELKKHYKGSILQEHPYAAAILADLPLRDHADLYKYVLHDRGNIFLQESLVQQLLRAGRASIREVSPDRDMKTIVMVEQWPDSEGFASTRWFCAPDGLPLFSFYNEIE